MPDNTALARRDRAHITDTPSLAGYGDGFDQRRQRSSDAIYVTNFHKGAKDGYKARTRIAETPLDMGAWPL